jgi:hypothetical protein
MLWLGSNVYHIGVEILSSTEEQVTINVEPILLRAGRLR